MLLLLLSRNLIRIFLPQISHTFLWCVCSFFSFAFCIRKMCILDSGSRRCAIIGVTWCLRRLSLFSTCLNTFSTNKSSQANHAETDPRHGTPAMAHVHRQIYIYIYMYIYIYIYVIYVCIYVCNVM